MILRGSKAALVKSRDRGRGARLVKLSWLSRARVGGGSLGLRWMTRVACSHRPILVVVETRTMSMPKRKLLAEECNLSL